MDEYQRASGARMNNKFIRKSIASLQPEYVPAKKDEKTKKTIPAHWDDNKTAIILINQARASLDTFGPEQYYLEAPVKTLRHLLGLNCGVSHF